MDCCLAVAPPEEASIIGIRRDAPCQTARASPASGGLSLGSCPARRSEHHRHQEGCSLSNCPGIICIRWTLAWQLPRPKKPASSASGGLLLVKLPERHLHQVDSRLAVAPPEEASIIGIRRAAPCQTSRASSASGGLSLGSCLARRSEHHRHQEGCSLSNCPSIICIRWTLAWQLPRPKKRASSASGGLLLVKLPGHHLHQVDSRLAVAPPEEASIIGIRRAAPCQTARASSASGGLSLARFPPRGKRASSASAGLLLVKLPEQLPEHHLHHVVMRLAVAPTKKRASSASTGLLLLPSIICINGGGGAPAKRESAFKRTSAWQVLPRPLPAPASTPPQRSEHHLHRQARASPASGGLSFGRCPQKKRALSASVGPLLLQMPREKRASLAGARPKKRASSASAGLLLAQAPSYASGEFSLGKCVPLHRSEHHRHQQRKTAPDAREASSICIKWTLAWQVPPPPTPFQVPQRSENQQHQQARASPASGGLLLGSCPARRSEHHRHQEGCSLSNCPSIICIRWTLAWQLPRPKKRASSASGGLLLVKLPQHHLHRVDSRLAVAPPEGLLLVKLPEHHLHQVDSRLAVVPPEEASIIGIRRAAPCQTAPASPASGGLSLGSCLARRSEHHRHQEGCSLSNCPSIICIRWTRLAVAPPEEASPKVLNPALPKQT